MRSRAWLFTGGLAAGAFGGWMLAQRRFAAPTSAISSARGRSTASTRPTRPPRARP